MKALGSSPASGGAKSPLDAGIVQPNNNVLLSDVEQKFHVKTSLKEQIANKIIDLFSMSLKATLWFAIGLAFIDAAFIGLKIISSDQRLMTERIVMTFVTATVVQVSAAVAAIVLAVFKQPSGTVE